MKNWLLITGIGLIVCHPSHAQEITEENYLKLDSILWTAYGEKEEEWSRLWETMPEKRDSIQAVFDQVYEETSRENRELAVRYASVPSGLKRLYMVRLDLPKETVSAVYTSLPEDMQQSFYGKNILAHLQATQVEEGSPIHLFPCTQDNGEPFDWETTTGKQLLILYGGLDCMGKQRRDYLQELYEKTSRDEFLILVYYPVSSLQYLKGMREQYPSDYIFISDFMRDASPIKIIYGSQGTPTCFLTDKNHIVKVKCGGVQPELFDEHIPYPRIRGN